MTDWKDGRKVTVFISAIEGMVDDDWSPDIYDGHLTEEEAKEIAISMCEYPNAKYEDGYARFSNRQETLAEFLDDYFSRAPGGEKRDRNDKAEVRFATDEYWNGDLVVTVKRTFIKEKK